MDIKEYSKLKSEGTVVIKKIGDKYYIEEKNWVKATGKEDIPTNTKLDIGDLESKKVFLQEEIDAIDVVIADCEALD